MSVGEGGQTGISVHVRPGTRLSGIYEIDQLIATGGMGEVFRGHNIETGEDVAVKIVLPEFARDKMILDLFRKEARILNHLNHEAIVRYHIFAIDPDLRRPYLAMEYVDGPSLAERLRTGPLAIREVISLQKRLADGLEKAHEAGVIHRDMSPDNVILAGGRVDRAKIIDFGIAKSAKDATLIGGNFAGKYSFVSPEQLGLFGGEVTAKSDIYSLGLVLAAALIGRPLDMSGSQVEVIEKRRVVPPLPDVDPRMLSLLRSMLQPDPADRPASMAVVRDWVTATDPTNLLTQPPRVTDDLGSIAERIPTRPPTTRGGRTAVKEPRRNAGVIVLIVLLLIIGGGAFGGWYYVERIGLWPSANPPPTQPPDIKTPPEPPPVQDKSAIIDAFLKTYDGGPCFTGFSSNDIGGTGQITVLSKDRAAADRVLADFKAKNNFEPKLQFNRVTPDQCLAVEAIPKLNAVGAIKPRLDLSYEQLASTTKYPGGGVRIRGVISNLEGRNFTILLIDNEGAINNLEKLIRRAGDTLTFETPLWMSRPSADDIPLLIMLVAYNGSSNALAPLIAEQTNVISLLPKLVSELSGRPNVATAIQHFIKAGDGGQSP